MFSIARWDRWNWRLSGRSVICVVHTMHIKPKWKHENIQFAIRHLHTILRLWRGCSVLRTSLHLPLRPLPPSQQARSKERATFCAIYFPSNRQLMFFFSASVLFFYMYRFRYAFKVSRAERRSNANRFVIINFSCYRSQSLISGNFLYIQ